MGFKKNGSLTIEQIKEAEKRFGAKRDLLLLDNNVLASCQFNKIIDEIVEAGFGKDSKYIPPNKYEIAIQNIKDNFISGKINDIDKISQSHEYLQLRNGFEVSYNLNLPSGCSISRIDTKLHNVYSKVDLKDDKLIFE